MHSVLQTTVWITILQHHILLCIQFIFNQIFPYCIYGHNDAQSAFPDKSTEGGVFPAGAAGAVVGVLAIIVALSLCVLLLVW